MTLHLDFIGSIENYSLGSLKDYINTNFQNQKFTELRLNIQSFGGSVTGAVAMYNYLKTLPFDIETHNLGEVTSAAVLLYLAGNVRTAERYSKFVIHPISFPASGNLSYFQVQEIANTLEKDIALYASIVNRETDSLRRVHNIEEILKGKSIALTPEAAQKCGIVNG